MYILVNKKPVDVFKIDAVSSVIPLDMKRYRAAVNYLEDPTFEGFRKMKIKADTKKSQNIVKNIIEYMINDVRCGDCKTMTGYIPTKFSDDYEKKNLGYYFCISPGKDENYICSRIYKTEAEAEKNLKDFLELINTVRSIVSEITI